MFLTNCTNKGCFKYQKPYLENDKVYCSICEQEIQNISSFTKNQMKSFKQFREKKQLSFSVKCPNCKKENRPVPNKDDFLCPSCKKSMNLSPIFKQMLKENLKKVND